MPDHLKKIRITCDSDELLSYGVIKDFQGRLKERSQDDIDHLISSIEHHGFSFPFFVWRQPNGTCSCLDGHGRLCALAQMESEGYEIPELPVVYIDAFDEKDAKSKLVRINTVAGNYSKVGFCDLIKDSPEVDLSHYHFPELDLEKIEAEMKLLWDAESMVQSDMVTGLCFEDEEVAADVSPISPSPVTISEQAPLNASIADGDEVIVQCPTCGHAFLYQENGGNNE